MDGSQLVDARFAKKHRRFGNRSPSCGCEDKNGCEDPSSGQILPPRGGHMVLIFGKLIGFERQYFATPPAKVAVYSFTGRR